MNPASVTQATARAPRDRRLVLAALRHPRGRYTAERAGQLSGVPARTLYDWAQDGVLVPDYAGTRPKAWSYRDLAFARLLAWLRQEGMDRPSAAEQINHIRTLLEDPASEIDEVHTDGHVALFDAETTDQVTGAQVFAFMSGLLPTFHLLEPIEELGRRKLWGPDLVEPTHHSAISPWAMGGDPCVRSTRIPTAGLYALRTERGLDSDRIAALYPGLTTEQVDDAIDLETRLRHAA
jgi:uncharacterized protein (DUF433 family)/DNA-binding transcriptional MerR regulator